MKTDKSKFKLQRPPMKSMKDIAYEAISSSILSGDIPAGFKLVEADLASQLNVSRGPVREALQRLEQEGLVCSFPYRGAVVAEISEHETREVYIPIRRIIERYAYLQARELLSDEDYTALVAIVDKLHDACLRQDAEEAATLDSEFHDTLVNKCVGPTLRAIWRSLSSRVYIQIHSLTRMEPSITHIAEQHYELLRALRTNDLEMLDKLMSEHIS
ncbi:MAG: GntR family transcriptional regulator [Christensenellales bacterium]|jgi:DNA-binding GntR family transcriptional regulator